MLFNRNWQVNVQADARFRMRVEDIGRLEVRNADGQQVPLRTLVHIKDTSGPAIVNHYNIYPSAEVNGNMAPGTSSGQAVGIMDQLSKEALPSTMGAQWTELTLQQIIASQDILTKLAFPLAVVFVFLVLSAQYESWSLPLSIILIVPMCLLASIAGIWLVEARQQHLHPDRPGRAGRVGRQERHPDRRVRQATAGPRGRADRGRRAKLAACGCGRS